MRGLLRILPDVKQALGEDWAGFAVALLDILHRLATTLPEGEEVDPTTRDGLQALVTLGLGSKAADLFRLLLDYASKPASLGSGGSIGSSVAHGASLPPRDPADLAKAIIAQVRVDLPEQRYLNTFFVKGEQVLADDQPLVVNQAYNLQVEISPQRRGLVADDKLFPVEQLPDDTLRAWRESPEGLPLTVWVASTDFDIEGSQIQTLNLPFAGPSPLLTFCVIPRRTEGKGMLEVDIFYKGSELQRIQISAAIVPVADIPIAPGDLPALSASVAFFATGKLDPSSLNEIPERVLTINVTQDSRDSSFRLRVLNRTAGDAAPRTFATHLQPQALQAAIAEVRKLLNLVVTGTQQGTQKIRGYESFLEGDQDSFAYWLPRLADIGHSLYTALFGDKDGAAPLAIEPGTIIQVNPVLGSTTIPWSLLYERDIMVVKGETKLCPDYATHGTGPCPHANEPKIVCPYGFWGIRYAIEQIPCWVNGEMPSLPTVVRQVCNDHPLRINLNVGEGFSYWDDQKDALAANPNVQMLVAKDLASMQEVWDKQGGDLGLVYFYTHGGTKDFTGPYLKLGADYINGNILDAIKGKWPRRPLVLLIGCATGDYGPESYVSLIDHFRAKEASGVVGTECDMPELFAFNYISRLLPRLFEGERLGQAMLELRRYFLLKKSNPLGLAYSLYAANDITLAQPLNQPKGKGCRP